MAFSVVLLLAMQLDPGALVPLYKQALAEAESSGSNDRIARSATDLGLYLRGLGAREEARVYLRRALELHTSPGSMENLASVLEPTDALPLYVKAGNWAKAGAMYVALGKKSDAIEAYRQAIAIEEKSTGTRLAVRLNDLAQLLEPKSAEPLLRQAMALETKELGSENPATATTMNNLASVLLDLKRIREAEILARKALGVLEAALGPQHPRVGTACSNLAAILREKPDLPGARAYYSRALAIDEAAYGPQHAEVAADLRSLAETLYALGRRSEAASLMRRASSIDGGR